MPSPLEAEIAHTLLKAPPAGITVYPRSTGPGGIVPTRAWDSHVRFRAICTLKYAGGMASGFGLRQNLLLVTLVDA